MTDQELFLEDLMHHGASATISNVSGDACPCMTWRDSDNPSYSAEWHRINSGSDDCNKTGLINRSTESTTVKAFFTNQLQTLSTMMLKEIMTVIGELQKDELLMYGTVDTSDGSFFDLSDLDEIQDTITYNSNTYAVRHVNDLRTDVTVGQIAKLVRTS